MNRIIVLQGFALAVGCACAMEWQPGDLAVPFGEMVELQTAGKSNTSLNIHGGMSVTLTSGNYTVVGEGGTTARIDLGSQPGDAGVLAVQGGNFIGQYSNQAKTSFFIGDGGGGADACLALTNVSAKFFHTFTLSAKAETLRDGFYPLILSGATVFEARNVTNGQSDKPMVVMFDGGDLRTFYNTPLADTTAGGDIILRSVNEKPITISSTRSDGTLKKLPETEKAGDLKTDGACDLVVMTSDGNKTCTARLDFNSPHVEWGHTGDTIFRYSGRSILSVDNILPYGPDTGRIVLETGSKCAEVPLTLDLNGTEQRMNGLLVRGGSIITNSSETSVAQLNFGTDDADALISGTVNAPEAQVKLVKTGDGRLLLFDATLDNLSVAGGTLVVSGAVSVAHLTLENVEVAYATESSNLSVGTWNVGEGVVIPLADGNATNAVVTAVCAVPGGVVEKTGEGFLTCFTPANAWGADLHVRGGTLRMGGASVDAKYWRFVAKEAWGGSKAFEHPDPTKSITVYLFLGGLGFFDAAGRSFLFGESLYPTQVNDVPSSIAGRSVSRNPWMDWDSDTGTAYFGTEKDPILGGARSRRPSLGFLHVTQSGTEIGYDTTDYYAWYAGTIYTNRQLVVDRPDTYEIIAWRKDPAWNVPVTSYNLKAMANRTTTDYPNVKSWEVQVSDDGTAWRTVDVRTGERPYSVSECGLDAGRRFTYNAHIPYLFSADRENWRFTTFGTVEVDAGATLDLSELTDANISFSSLRINLDDGAGTITKFAPGANGALYLESSEALPGKFVLPVKIENVINGGNLASWKVYWNGVLQDEYTVGVNRSLQLVVRKPSGLMLLFR